MSESNEKRWYVVKAVTGKEKKVKELIEQGYNVLPVRFRRETDAVISLRVIFKYGKLFFSIKRTDEFIDYLNTQNKW